MATAPAGDCALLGPFDGVRGEANAACVLSTADILLRSDVVLSTSCLIDCWMLSNSLLPDSVSAESHIKAATGATGRAE